MTDGVLEPNPPDKAYEPLNYEYKYARATASGTRRRELEDEYRERLCPIARRLIAEDILPALSAQGVEIFTVALGSSADRGFLAELADRTSRHPAEVHSFSAKHGTDLVGIFASLASYWSDWVEFQNFTGPISQEGVNRIELDTFVREPRLLAMVDGDAVPEVQAEGGQPEQGRHSGLGPMYSFELAQKSPPGAWQLRFAHGSGSYSALLLGHNKLRLMVDGIRTTYRFGETIRAKVSLEARDGLAFPTEVKVRSSFGRDEAVLEQAELRSGSGGTFLFDGAPTMAGSYLLRFEAFAKDRDGHPITPRPSLEYRVEVLPALYAEQKSINFGNHDRGDSAVAPLVLHSGLASAASVSITGEVTHSSGGALLRNERGRLPSIAEIRTVLQPGTVASESIRMDFPRKGERGDFEGMIHVRSSRGDYQVPFRAHVPTIWEQLRFPSLFAIIATAILLAYLASVWGLLAGPSGVLVPVGNAIMAPIRLNGIKKGIFARYLNYKRNQVELGRALRLPAGVEARLVFYAWRAPSLKNLSLNDKVIRITELSGYAYPVRPGQAFSLRHNSLVDFDGHIFRYQNLMKR